MQGRGRCKGLGIRFRAFHVGKASGVKSSRLRYSGPSQRRKPKVECLIHR